MAKFAWSQFQEAGDTPKFDWNQFQAEGAAPKGVQVWDKPAGPEQASAVDRFVERVQDPQRWKAILTGEGPQAPDIVKGAPPLALPGSAIPKLTAAATTLAEGKGLGWALGRTALSAGQGAAMSAMSGGDGEASAKAKNGALLAGGIQAAAESVPYVGKAIGAVARKVGSSLTGVSEDLISNYARRTDEVNKIIRESGEDITTAADQIRIELSGGIQKAKGALNRQISTALDGASAEAAIDIRPIIERLETAKQGLNPNLKAGAVSDLDEIIQTLRKEAPEGKVNLKSLYEIKQYLNEASSGAYNKGGQIFNRATEAARAAKGAAGEARDILHPLSDDIAQADRQLSKLRSIEGRLNRNLLAPGKSDSALMAAGSGANPRNAATLRELEKISGVPVSQRAQDLATAKQFANLPLIPTDGNGKTAARMLLGGAVGLGAERDNPGLGFAAGALLANPALMKAGINAANVARKMTPALPSASQFIRENPGAASMASRIAAGAERGAVPVAAPQFSASADQPDTEKVASIQAQRTPATGEAKWAAQGIQKLGIQDDSLTQRLMSDPRGRELLIQASDLSPNSKAMKRIVAEIQKGWANQ